MAAASSTTRPAPKSRGAAIGRNKKGNVFHQRLASLTFYQACQLLGDDGAKLFREGERLFDLEPDRDVFLGGDLFRVRLEDPAANDGLAICTLTLQSAREKQLQLNCDRCDLPCVHGAAALAYLLETKSVLGLAAPPDESVPLENLTVDELLQRAMAERIQRSSEERMTVRSTDPAAPWTDYIVTSEASGKVYRVALRGKEPHQSYCSCPDFRTNSLGTCKHILHVQSKVARRFTQKVLEKPYKRRKLSLGLRYGDDFGLRFNLPAKSNPKIDEIVGTDGDQSQQEVGRVVRQLEALQHAGIDVNVYPDAEAFIQRTLVQQRLKQECESIRKDPVNHPLREHLLKTRLLP